MMDNECRVMLDNDGKSVCRVHGEAWPCPELQRLNALVASATQVRELRPSIWPAPAGGVARRNRADLFTPAERAIYDAVHIVEDAGAHPRLTDAVILLGKAREAVADFVDGVDTPASLAVGEPVAWRLRSYIGRGESVSYFTSRDKAAAHGRGEYRIDALYATPPAAPVPEVSAKDIEIARAILRDAEHSSPDFTRRILAALEHLTALQGRPEASNA